MPLRRVRLFEDRGLKPGLLVTTSSWHHQIERVIAETQAI